MKRLKGPHTAFWVSGLVLAAAVCAARPPMGKPAPEFSLIGLNIKDSIALSSFRGRVVLLDFWASWCLPCKRLLPMLSDLKQRLPDLEIIAVSVDVDRNKAVSFLRGIQPNLKAAHDADQKTSEAYGVEWMPTSILVDKYGRLRFRHDGYTAPDLENVEREASLLLTESEKPARK